MLYSSIQANLYLQVYLTGTTYDKHKFQYLKSVALYRDAAKISFHLQSLKSVLNIMRSVVHKPSTLYWGLLFRHTNHKFLEEFHIKFIAMLHTNEHCQFCLMEPHHKQLGEPMTLQQWLFFSSLEKSSQFLCIIVCLIYFSVSLIYDLKEIQPKPVH